MSAKNDYRPKTRRLRGTVPLIRDDYDAAMAEIDALRSDAIALNLHAARDEIDALKAQNLRLVATNEGYCFDIMSLEEALEIHTEILATERNALRVENENLTFDKIKLTSRTVDVLGQALGYAEDLIKLRTAIVRVKRSVTQWRSHEPLTDPRSVYELIALVPDNEWLVP